MNNVVEQSIFIFKGNWAIPASAAVRRATDRTGEPVAAEKQILYT
jgi:hypothetical protein